MSRLIAWSRFVKHLFVPDFSGVAILPDISETAPRASPASARLDISASQDAGLGRQIGLTGLMFFNIGAVRFSTESKRYRFGLNRNCANHSCSKPTRVV